MRKLAPLFLALALTGCPDESKDTTYAGSARNGYMEGLDAYEDEDYLEAVKHFTFVKNKYAYSKYAALAELRIADSYFEQDKYVEAIDAYRNFVQGRPNHREVPYALWRIGVSYFEQIPGDFIIFPPAHEKDQAPTKDALRALETYVERFPKHEHVPKARERITECRRMLAEQELYVARFYLRDDRPVSARGRLEHLVSQYGDVPDLWAQAALLLAQTYLDLKMTTEAAEVAQRLVREHPDRPEAGEARDLMAGSR